jgi:hypothetical protein
LNLRKTNCLAASEFLYEKKIQRVSKKAFRRHKTSVFYFGQEERAVDAGYPLAIRFTKNGLHAKIALFYNIQSLKS